MNVHREMRCDCRVGPAWSEQLKEQLTSKCFRVSWNHNLVLAGSKLTLSYAGYRCCDGVPRMDCAQAGKDARVLRNPKVQALKPLQSAMWVSHHVIHSSYLQTCAQYQQLPCFCM